ncbi:hypothetical protein KEM48_003659 [Puccinia striiformis f. sp. tritici PST-130]|nr:hypothetical protein KEM48_003659 [Puccinia striiformis f. sp. tritici PST-130]
MVITAGPDLMGVMLDDQRVSTKGPPSARTAKSKSESFAPLPPVGRDVRGSIWDLKISAVGFKDSAEIQTREEALMPWVADEHESSRADAGSMEVDHATYLTISFDDYTTINFGSLVESDPGIACLVCGSLEYGFYPFPLRCITSSKQILRHCRSSFLEPSSKFIKNFHFITTSAMKIGLDTIISVLLLPVASQSIDIPSNRRIFQGNLGLNSSNLHRGGVAVGFLPGFRERIAPNAVRDINNLLPAPMAIVGDYIHLAEHDPNLSALDLHLPHILSAPGNPVWQIALQPSEGLEKVTPYVAIVLPVRWPGSIVTVSQFGYDLLTRFAENLSHSLTQMNGDWYGWGLKPELFRQKWRMIAQAIKARTHGTYMLWAPNVAFGTYEDSIRGGYSRYWPGADTVDISGLSFYHFGGEARLNVLPRPGEVLEKLQQFSELYGTGQGKPIVLAETGAAYTTSLRSGRPTVGGASNHDIKFAWLQQLLSGQLKQRVPELKAISWFELIKDENAGVQGTSVRCEDYRLIVGEERLSRDAVRYLEGSYN